MFVKIFTSKTERFIKNIVVVFYKDPTKCIELIKKEKQYGVTANL